MLITVVIPTRDRQTVLREALASLAAQECTDFEVIVVNDGGTSADDIVAEWRQTMPIVAIDVPRSQGPPAARNLGIAAARGRFLAFLDDDDIFLPSHLRLCLQPLLAGTADLVYTDCLVSPRRHAPGELRRDTAGAHYFDYPFDPDFLLVCNFIPIISVVCRNIAAIDAQFKCGLSSQEDWDLWLRLRFTRQFRFVHLPVITTIYHRSPGLGSSTGIAGLTASAMSGIARDYDALAEQWPVGDDTRIASCRDLVRRYSQLCITALEEGRGLAHFRYEKSLRIIRAAFEGKIAIAAAARRIEEAITDRTLTAAGDLADPLPAVMGRLPTVGTGGMGLRD